jgi:hypothetical protein
MSTIKIVFQEKGKNNEIILGKPAMPFSELVQLYYKKICASKKDKMTKIFLIKGTEHSPDESSTLAELDMHDMAQVEIQSTEKAVTGSSEPPKKEEPPQEEVHHEEPPQEEEQPQEEIHEEPPQEEQPQEEQPQEDNEW